MPRSMISSRVMRSSWPPGPVARVVGVMTGWGNRSFLRRPSGKLRP